MAAKGYHMKSIDINQLTADPQQYLEQAQEEPIVVTSDGTPRAVLHGVDDDVETAELVRSPEFWAMIRDCRQQPTIPWEETKRQLQNEP
jgi:prevent-host-death family protein